MLKCFEISEKDCDRLFSDNFMVSLSMDEGRYYVHFEIFSNKLFYGTRFLRYFISDKDNFYFEMEEPVYYA